MPDGPPHSPSTKTLRSPRMPLSFTMGTGGCDGVAVGADVVGWVLEHRLQYLLLLLKGKHSIIASVSTPLHQIRPLLRHRSLRRNPVEIGRNELVQVQRSLPFHFFPVAGQLVSSPHCGSRLRFFQLFLQVLDTGGQLVSPFVRLYLLLGDTLQVFGHKFIFLLQALHTGLGC